MSKRYLGTAIVVCVAFAMIAAQSFLAQGTATAPVTTGQVARRLAHPVERPSVAADVAVSAAHVVVAAELPQFLPVLWFVARMVSRTLPVTGLPQRRRTSIRDVA